METPFEEVGKAGKLLSDLCQSNGLIVRRDILDTIALCPPLIISEKEIDELTEKLRKSLQLGVKSIERSFHIVR